MLNRLTKLIVKCFVTLTILTIGVALAGLGFHVMIKESLPWFANVFGLAIMMISVVGTVSVIYSMRNGL